MNQNLSKLYIEDIKENIRNKHAAVLIGSGFSRNANRVDGSNTQMPDWFGLADAFSKKLGIDPFDKDARYSNPLALAQQVIEVYGRPYMNNLLRELMDDDAYSPGVVHDLLISLPWTDIFTTNYDTLLERAYQKGIKRRYKVIYNQDDLLYSAGNPRIVKLHGSFPSHEPFIISEEDYRRYPQGFSPFINTVQQSLLENLFVLIGFSGTDPNFLNWIGWIHDNLGLNNSPRIYLIACNHESEVKTKMLDAKNIDIVVLNDIPLYESDSHKESLEKFLRDLNDYVSTSNNRHPWPKFFLRNYNSTVRQVLDKLTDIQESYPGWIIARFKSLSVAKNHMVDFEFHIRRIGHDEKIEKEELNNELEICDRFSWLCKMIGTIVSRYTIAAIEKILNRHKDKARTEGFLRIELFMLKCYRITGDKNWEIVYRNLKAKIHKTGLWNELYAELTYEYAMRLLFSFKWDNLEEAVRMIPCDTEHGEWILKKAGLLSMLGYYKEAIALLLDGIEYARKILLGLKKDNIGGYNRFISLESCMIALLKYIQQTYDSSMGNFTSFEPDDYDEKAKDKDSNNEINKESAPIRSKQTTNKVDEPYGRDYVNDYIWYLENEKFSNSVSDSYKPRPSVTQTPSFDIDRISLNRHLGGDDEGIMAVQFVAFREATGQPFRIGNVTNKDGIFGTISRLNWVSHRLAVVLAVLAGEKKAVETALTRMALANMKAEEIDCLTKELVGLMTYCIDYVEVRNKATAFDSVIQDYVLHVVPEAISRLVTKCSQDVFEIIIMLLVKIYSLKRPDQSIDVKHLVERSIKSMSYDTFEKLLNKLWSIDIKPDNSYFNSNFPDPLYVAHTKVLTFRNKQIYEMNSEQIELFKGWLERAKDRTYKGTALSRLSYIFRMYKLPEDLKNGFKDLIWAEENLDTYGLPNLGAFSKVVAIDYPHDVDDRELQDAAVRYVVDRYKDYIKKKVLTDFTNLFNMTESLIELANIDENKCKQILHIILKFCEMIEENSKLEMSVGLFDFKQILDKIDAMVGFLLLKSGVASKDKTINDESVIKIIEILDRAECPHALLSWCMPSEDRYEKIVSSVLSSDPAYTRNANQALYHLIKAGVEVDKRIVDLMTHSVATTLAYNVNSYALGLELLVRQGVLNDENMKLLSEALPKFDQITRIDILDDEDDVIRKMGMRKVISILSRTMYKRYEKSGKIVPDGVVYWKELVKNKEEFAEIRLAWDATMELL